MKNEGGITLLDVFLGLIGSILIHFAFFALATEESLEWGRQLWKLITFLY